MSERKSWPPAAPEPQDESTPEPFLRRWSRLKADPAARGGEDTAEPVAPAPDEVAAATEPGDAPQASDEQLPPTDDDLPPLEALDEHSDYSGFMSSRVSATLRKQALRKLFRSEKFNYICELDDYIDDYTSFPPLGDTVTADMKHAAERLLKKQLEAEEAAAAAAATDAEAAPGAAAADTADTDAQTDAQTDAELHNDPHADADADDGTVAAAGTDEAAQTDDASGEPPDAATEPNEEKQRDA